VTQVLIRLIIAFAFIASTMHAPVTAHVELVNPHSGGVAASTHDMITDHHDDVPSSPDGAGDGVHHHHCPTAVDTRVTDDPFGGTSGKALLSLLRSTTLTSFNQAPPTEPPSV
jgi:hypothetical protein